MNVRINLDMDETLVYSRRVEGRPKLATLPGAIVFEDDIDHVAWVTFLRPGAKEFIATCQQLAPTNILTAGSKRFQTLILEKHGITTIPIFGREDYALIGHMPKTILHILIDDLDIETMGVQAKIQALCPDLYYESDEHLCAKNPKRFQLIQTTCWMPDLSIQTVEFPQLLDKIKAVIAHTGVSIGTM